MYPRSSRPAQPTTTFRPIASRTYTPTSETRTFCQKSVIVGGKNRAIAIPIISAVLAVDRRRLAASEVSVVRASAGSAIRYRLPFAVAAVTPAVATRLNPRQANQPPEPRFCHGPEAESTLLSAPILLIP